MGRKRLYTDEQRRERRRAANKKYYAKIKDDKDFRTKERERRKIYHNENKDNPEYKAKETDRAKAHYQKNKDDEQFKANRRAYQKEYAKSKRKSDKVWSLRRNIGTTVSMALKRQEGSKKGESTFKYLPYTLQQLKEHLETQFDENMCWDNYGSYWEVDHIYPQSKLPYDSMEHPNFQKCWALSNLRPLEAGENRSKGAKII